MNQEMMASVTAMTECLVTQASHEDGHREDIRALAKAVLVATERSPLLLTPGSGQQFPGGEELVRQGPELPPTIEEESVSTTAMPEVSRTAPLPELTLGRCMPSECSVC